MMQLLQQLKQYLKPMDWVVLTIALFSLIPLYAGYWQQQGSADYVLITSPMGVQRVSLDQLQTLSVKGHLGHSHLEIQQGKIRFIDSPCKGKYCIHAGWQQSGGAFAACLPNHILLEIRSAQTEQFDSISY
ncbi:NusG domain II-containing protein [Candidatus Albibeggiatoa sp. nov. NOAA]|uniref:NusG domain II-containing protein n=1 Tax=Candidatus Albibeggiatoa sp. nov. NOAA TaxID=3162724 RepID=UPI0032F838E2|nr:NusG domain II-containing protein [Thiotrichaceae bacterium]